MLGDINLLKEKTKSLAVTFFLASSLLEFFQYMFSFNVNINFFPSSCASMFFATPKQNPPSADFLYSPSKMLFIIVISSELEAVWGSRFLTSLKRLKLTNWLNLDFLQPV